MIAKVPDIPVRSHPLSHVDEYLEIGQKAGASDVHLAVNAQPIWRLHGTLQPIWPDAPRLRPEDTVSGRWMNSGCRSISNYSPVIKTD